METSRRILLCVVLVFRYVVGIPATDIQRPPEERWLEDFDTFPVDEMVADSPYTVDGASQHCPLVQPGLSPDACGALPCLHDADCEAEMNTMKCCDNGCVRTCQHAVLTPPYVDWKRNPPPLRESGDHWLVAGFAPLNPVAWCSTSQLFDDTDEDDDDDEEEKEDVRRPFMCPRGYVCHIDYTPDDPTAEIPNRGHCMPDKRADHQPERMFRLGSAADGDRGACTLRNAIISNTKRFIYKHHVCVCTDGFITCNVAAHLP